MTIEYNGLLCIGDPHLASRVPGFRKDDYPLAILEKLTWAISYARENSLLPIILGDLFHWPRDNANWMLVRLLELFKQPILGVAGNHDCKENELRSDDALSILWAAGRLQLLDRSGPWIGAINDRTVIIGGTAWGQPLPIKFDPTDLAVDNLSPIVVWISHHNVRFPNYEEVGRIVPQEICGIDIFINGHIHRPLSDVVVGSTTWVNPGNIARVRRSDADRNRRPSVLRINFKEDGWEKQVVMVPFQPYEEVFHDEIVTDDIVGNNESVFIRGLASLESLRTHDGTGLMAFLDQNLGQFDVQVAAEIRTLAEEIYGNGDEFGASTEH